MKKHTPLMQQYWDIKNDYKDFLVFFQVGDFFELFFEDAKKAASFLGITLTQRGKDADGKEIPLCGVPVHTLDHYLQKLVKGGFCIVLCEQLEQAVPGKMVKRGVTRVLTPGTLTETTLLNESKASYILAFVPEKDNWGLLFAELMTAQMYATSLTAGSLKSLETELARFLPDEIIVDKKTDKTFQTLFQKQGFFTSIVSSEIEDTTWLQEHFKQATVAQLKANKTLESAINALYVYFKKNNESALQSFNNIHFYQPEDFLLLDATSLKNLEIIKNNQDGSSNHTLVSVLNKTCTAMGLRMLKKWLVRPLVNKTMIEQRLDVVDCIKSDYLMLLNIQKNLKVLGDLERIIGRIALLKGRFDDYMYLLQALTVFKEFIFFKKEMPIFFESLKNNLEGFDQLYNFLKDALNQDHTKDWIIKKGFDKELDRLRMLVFESHTALQLLEKKEQEATGINSLKMRYTPAFGYSIEITHTHAHLIPERYKRQQTLISKERYMIPELQDLQQEIIAAKNQMSEVESKLFGYVQNEVRPFLGGLRKAAHILAQLDVLTAFAYCAYEQGYVRPLFHEKREISIEQSKHPVVEKEVGSRFIANDCLLNEKQSTWLITGPNMGGKSTFLRQMALIPLMAQCGSFVPAKKALLPVLDAIYTRIGASDNLAQGKSTFLVEMEEAAHICRYATEKSLVILDEVGRGTSTFDGIALAQSIIEYIHQTIRAYCLFATHYHELTSLEESIKGIVNYHAASIQTKDGVVFLHTIIPGSSQASFGLSVARIAQLPHPVIDRAHQVMKTLISATTSFIPAHKIDFEKDALKKDLEKYKQKIDLIAALDYENLSPKKAFDFLWSFKDDL